MNATSYNTRPWVGPATLVTATALAIVGLLTVRGMTYRDTVSWAVDLPGPVQSAFTTISQYGIVVLAGLFAVGLFRARQRGVRPFARGVAAGLGVVAAYASSEVLKVLVSELRPCHNFAERTLVTCPGTTDWSWPSNHAAIAVAIAVAIVTMAPRLGLLAFLLAALIAVSRVIVGVHYFHDVLAGALIAAITVALVVRLATPLTYRALELTRRLPFGDRLVAGH